MNSEQPSRILVVEDERHIAFGIKYNLEAEGFQVAIAVDGPAALRMVKEGDEDFDLIILDLMLPGMSGYAVCRTLREEGYFTPILILSARAVSEDRTLGFDAGANQYLTKPFDLDELLARVRNLLSRQGHHHPPTSDASDGGMSVYEFNHARIDFAAYEARVGERTFRLTALQLRLLEYLIERHGRVVTRQELLEKVWGLPGYVNTRAPDQLLRQLRKIFEPEPSRPRHFLTIRDVGYRFVPDPSGDDDE